MFICVGIRVHGHESRGMDASNELVKPQFYMMFVEQGKGNECVGRLNGDAQQQGKSQDGLQFGCTNREKKCIGILNNNIGIQHKCVERRQGLCWDWKKLQDECVATWGEGVGILHGSADILHKSIILEQRIFGNNFMRRMRLP